MAERAQGKGKRGKGEKGKRGKREKGKKGKRDSTLPVHPHAIPQAIVTQLFNTGESVSAHSHKTEQCQYTLILLGWQALSGKRL